MELEQFTRRTRAAVYREAAALLRAELDRLSKNAWHPLVDQALRHTADGLDDTARKFEEGED